MLPKIKSIQIIQDIRPFVLDDQNKDIWALLHSGKTGFGHRFSIIGQNPFLIIEGQGAHKSRVYSTTGYREKNENAWTLLQMALDRYRVFAQINDEIPFSSGAILAMAYDAFDPGEKKAGDATVSEETLWACFFKDYDIYDHLTGKHWAVHLRGPGTFNPNDIKGNTVKTASSLSGISPAEYISGVKKIKAYIRQGRIYQVNYAQQFSKKTTLSPFDIFVRLNRANPAPMSGLIKIRNRALISSSPERFLKCRNRELESNPIKGTRPRFHDFARDRDMVRELWHSPKENAELAMIVDLMRNDLGRNARPGSVRVATSKRIENYNNVFHLVARVCARAGTGKKSLKMIQDAYPPGSVTGCPKLESRRVIAEMEKHARGFYTGAMGFLDFNGNFDLNVMIRTLYYRQGWVRFGLGSGIVCDSIPDAEYQETLDKGQTIFEILK